MQELSFDLEPYLRAGLRPDIRLDLNDKFLTLCQNMKPNKDWGLVRPENLSYPITSPAFSRSWPWPQLKRSDHGLLLRTPTSLYSVNESSWATTAIPLYQAASPATTATLAGGGGDLHTAIFQSSYWLTDGVNLIFNTPGNSGNKTLVFDSSTVSCATLCEYGQRLFLAGLSGSYFASSAWLAFMDKWRASSQADIYTAANEPLGTNFILWGEFAGGDTDYPFEVFKRLLGLSTGDSTRDAQLDTHIHDYLERGIIGLIPATMVGPIEAIKPLGSNLRSYQQLRANLMAYGTYGVSSFVPERFRHHGQTNVVGYAEHRMDNLAGIAGRGSVAGDDSEHIYLAVDGYLYKNATQGAARSGYGEFLGALSGVNTVISFDRGFRDFWICDGSLCYVFTPSGLGGPMSLQPSSVVRSPGSATLLGTAPAVTYTSAPSGSPPDLNPADTTLVRIISNPVDLDQRGNKHITALQVACGGLKNQRGTVWYRYGVPANDVRHRQMKIGPFGFGRIDVTAMEFQIEYLATIYTGGDTTMIDNIEVRYQKDDRREIRGTQGTAGRASQQQSA